MEKSLPWWGCVALILVAVEYVNQDLLDGSALNLRQVSQVRAARRLDEMPQVALSPSPAPQEFDLDPTQTIQGTNHTLTDVDNTDPRHPHVGPYIDPAEIENKVLFMEVPCLDLLFFSYQLILPCGNLSVPPEGIEFETFFGEYHVPGSAVLVDTVRHTEREMTRYTILLIILGVIGWLCSTFCIPSNRERFVSKVQKVLSGKLASDFDDEDDEDDSDAENPGREEELKARLDPMSPEFIAPGNIYRVLAVLHPGIIGYVTWLGYALRASIVAYMQIWIPYNIVTNTLKRWQCLGVKSPLWFLANGGTFLAMVTALGTLSSMFAQKCVRHIFHGAEANMYILSYDNPSDGDRPASRRSSVSSQASEQPLAGLGGLSEGVEQAFGSLKGGVGTAYQQLQHPELSDKSASFNEYFWCNVSMLLNVVMSVLLELAMFLKVATFTGRIANVAMTAVSLYFIFDLDNRIMDADPKLKRRYRRTVAAQTVPIAPEKRPRMIPIMANIFAAIVNLTVPLALVGVVLIAWRRYDDGFIIGGDGLSVV